MKEEICSQPALCLNPAANLNLVESLREKVPTFAKHVPGTVYLEVQGNFSSNITSTYIPMKTILGTSKLIDTIKYASLVGGQCHQDFPLQETPAACQAARPALAADLQGLDGIKIVRVM